MQKDIERFYTPGLAQVAYGVADPEHGVAAIIDPRRDIGEYLAWAERQGLRIVAILETHVHADFVSGARELAAATGATIHAGRLGESEFPHHPVDDGESVAVGDLRLQTLWTPGHTPEHISWLLFDDRVGAGDAPIALFSGDTLFAGEIGRPDLLGEEQTEALVRQLEETVHQRLADLPDALTVYPGHGAGSPCGKQIGDSATTTIGQEKQFNYAFQAGSGEAFAKAVLEGMPRPPAYYPHLKRINKLGPRLLGELPEAGPMSADEVAAQQQGGALILDVRSAADFDEGHIPGAVNVGLDGSFPLWVGWLAPYDREVVLILPADERAGEALRHLQRIGVDDVAGYLTGGMEAWRASGRPEERLTEWPVEALANQMELAGGSPMVLDVREAPEWEAGHIPGAQHIPAGVIARGETDGLPRDREIAVICGTGYRSNVAASLLQARGYDNVVTVPGGMEAWREAKLPIA